MRRVYPCHLVPRGERPPQVACHWHWHAHCHPHCRKILPKKVLQSDKWHCAGLKITKFCHGPGMGSPTRQVSPLGYMYTEVYLYLGVSGCICTWVYLCNVIIGGSEGVAVCGRGDRAGAAQGVAAFSVSLSCTLRKLMLARGTH